MLRHKLFVKYLRMGHHPGKIKLLKLLKKLLVLDDIRSLTNSGIEMSLNYGEYVQDHILLYGNYEINTIALLKKILKPGDTFLDVGGHVGQYALEAAQIVGSSGKVISIEPNPRTFSYLLKNIRLNGFGTIIPILGAASNSIGLVGMQLPPDNNWGTSREAPNVENIEYYTIAIRLDELLHQLNVTKIDVMKIDVEGAELKVLEGLFESGYFVPRHILFEYIPEHFKESVKVAQYLLSKEYELFNVSEDAFDIGSTDSLLEENVWARLKF
jgi:FkbM family methyltransferase